MELSRIQLAGALGVAAVVGALATLLATDRDPGHTPTVLATAVVAVIVAAITAVTTDRRQDRSLSAEQYRLTIRHQHERIMSDLEELRRVLDDALAAGTQLRGYARLVLHTMGDEPESDELAHLWWGNAHAAIAQGGRLQVRLGQDHAAARTYLQATTLIQECVAEFRQMRGDEAKVRQRSERGVDEFEDKLAGFVTAARGLVGSADEIVRHGK
jgi:hypothetical protein